MNRRVFFIVIFLIVIVAVTAFVYTRTLQKPAPPTTTRQSNVWSGVIPGQTTADEIYQRLGVPVASTGSAAGQTLSYPSANKYWTNDIDVQNNKAVFIKERVFAPAELSLSKRVASLGGDGVTLYGPDFSSGINLYVFPSLGVALYGSQAQNIVYEVWRFTPTTIQGFLASPQAQGFSPSSPSGSF